MPELQRLKYDTEVTRVKLIPRDDRYTELFNIT